MLDGFCCRHEARNSSSALEKVSVTECIIVVQPAHATLFKFRWSKMKTANVAIIKKMYE